MKKLLILFGLCILFFTSCGTGKKTTYTGWETYDKMYATELIVTMAQLDSVCVADTLPTSFKEWYTAAFVDYETNKAKQKKYYIRASVSQRKSYILSPYNDDKFKLVIRTEINEE